MMDRGSAADSRLNRSASVVDSASMRSGFSILNSKFASGTRNPSVDEINRITAELQRHGPVEGKNVFFWFQNAAARDKLKKEKAVSCDRRKKEKAESSSKWPAVFRPRSWTSLFRAKRSSERSNVQEEEEEVDSGPRRNSSVEPADIRTLELFPLHPDL
ncbi:WUSCHEL-related homeobox 4-like isoform X2 [Cryptomeria japonica]|uniref:WUSCHEL-related homeobox 4-like isoform X2 n=1 Tax=Cryptomeria japonica TaxID=3369 RepID=UPI0027DA6298|nr:WUSCHEL-related homeobox 4-like isoform X2 [Cryptomeria japonica]